MRHFKSLFFATAFLGCAIATAASADQLADVKASGKLVCGVVSNLEPFAFQDTDTQELKGYDVDFCKAVAKSIGVEPEIKIISFEARIPELTQGRVDILAAVLGYTPARAEQIDFSDAYFVSIQKMSVRGDAAYQSLGELDGKRIGAVKGSSTLKMLGEKLPGATVVSFDDAPAAFMAMMQGKVESFGQSETLLRRLIAKAGPDQNIRVIMPPLGQEAWGLGLRKNEPAFAQAVNSTLQQMEKSGDAAVIFERWLGKDTAFKMQREFTVQPIAK